MGRPYEEAVGVAAGVREEEVQEVPLSGEEHPEVHPVVAAAGSDCSPLQPPTHPPLSHWCWVSRPLTWFTLATSVMIDARLDQWAGRVYRFSF